MDIGRAALIVVDMQNGFISEHSQPVVPAVTEVVTRWTAAGRPVVFTRYHNYPGSPFERLIGWSQLQASPEVDIVDELASYVDQATVLDKHVYTMFSTEGSALVAERGWTDLVFCGIATESCVLKSAVDAFELGYTPWVLTDASASHAGREAHGAGLLCAQRFIGAAQLITTEQLFVRLPV